MIKWKDATDYSQGQRGKAPQTSWECNLSGLRIWVSCRHVYYPDEWVFSCDGLGIKATALGPEEALTQEEARKAALHTVASRLKQKLETMVLQVRALEAELTE